MEKERDTIKKEHDCALSELEAKIKQEMLQALMLKDKKIDDLTNDMGVMQAKIKAMEKKTQIIQENNNSSFK